MVQQSPVEPKFIKEGTLAFGSKDVTGTFLPTITIDIEVAATSFETSRGLMYRTSMKEKQGMLFIFNRMEPQFLLDEEIHIFPLTSFILMTKGKS